MKNLSFTTDFFNPAKDENINAKSAGGGNDTRTQIIDIDLYGDVTTSERDEPVPPTKAKKDWTNEPHFFVHLNGPGMASKELRYYTKEERDEVVNTLAEMKEAVVITPKKPKK